MVKIRDARPEDWEAIWPFFDQIVAAGETYAYDPAMTEPEGRRIWMIGHRPARTVVATDADGAVLGTANMYANREGPGSHVASASFMVDPAQSGRGVGRALGEHVIEWARESGLPGDPVQRRRRDERGRGGAVAFARLRGDRRPFPRRSSHPKHGYVGLLIMHRFSDAQSMCGAWPAHRTIWRDQRDGPPNEKIARPSAGQD